MSGAPIDPQDVLRGLAEAGKSIRFGRGVVGKSGHAVLALLGLWAVVLWRLGENWQLNLGLFLTGLLATCVVVWWTRSSQTFAERNPAQAMLEGAELIEYARMEAEAKGLKNVDNSRQLSEVATPLIENKK